MLSLGNIALALMIVVLLRVIFGRDNIAGFGKFLGACALIGLAIYMFFSSEWYKGMSISWGKYWLADVITAGILAITAIMCTIGAYAKFRYAQEFLCRRKDGRLIDYGGGWNARQSGYNHLMGAVISGFSAAFVFDLGIPSWIIGQMS